MFDFTENATVDSLDAVPKDFQGLYLEADGKFKLNSEDPQVGSAVKALVGQSKALNASRGEVKAAKAKIIDLSGLSDFGSDPTSILEGFNTQLEAVKKTAKGKGNEDVDKAVKAAQEAMTQAHTKELGTRDTRTKALEGQLHGLLVGASATKALADANAVDASLLMPFVEKQVKVVEADGKLEVRVLSDAGEERFGGTGNHMTMVELVEEMKSVDRYKPLFKSEAPSGGGRQHTHTPGRTPSGGKDKSSTAKISDGLAARK